MKIDINNLTALIQGRELNLYQRSLAVEEWHKLLDHVEEMEQALSIANVVGRSEQLRAFKQFLQSEYHLPVSNRMVDEFEQKQSS